jgi:hypothetical protein
MAAKYKELAGANQGYVNSLRQRLAKHSEKCALLKEEMSAGFIQRGRQFTNSPGDLAEEGDNLQREIAILEMEIEKEYENVPHARARSQGIAAFWKEVGGALQ